MTAASLRLLRAALLAFFAWSLAVWVLVQFGLGGRHSLHPDDPDAVAPLPELALNRAESRLAPFAEYAAVGDRPLFNPDRRPTPPGAGDEPAVAAEPEPTQLDVVVTSVIIAGDNRFAIVTSPDGSTSQTVRVGQALEGAHSSWRLVDLQPRGAVFEGPGGDRRNSLELRVFDGTGGQPPTPVEVRQADGQASAGQQATAAQDATANGEPAAEQTPEARAELIRKRIEERRRQMREEAARATQERGQ